MEEAWVKELRSQFPVTEKSAFFDIAYENCGADYMERAIERFFRDKADLAPDMPKMGGGGKGRVVEVVASARKKLAAFLGAPGPKNIAFTANTCQAVSLAVMGLHYRPGDNIVVGAMEHVSVLMPCLQARKLGVACKVVDGASGLWVTAEELLSAVDEHTRLVAVSYVQSGSGYRIDLKHLVEECHKRGVLVVTDAIQALGLVEMDVQTLGVDALAASGYKGMLAMEGMGFLYLSDTMLPQVDPVFACYNAAMTVDREEREIRCLDAMDARKLEAGTIPFSSIYVLEAALDLFRHIGPARIAAHVSQCFEAAYRGLEALGFRMATLFDAKRRCASFLVCTEPGREEAMAEFLQRRNVYVSTGKNSTVRVSVAPFTNQEDLRRLLEAAKAWRDSQ